jgi:hypothetical protein
VCLSLVIKIKAPAPQQVVEEEAGLWIKSDQLHQF